MRRSSPSRVFVLAFLGLALSSGVGVGALRCGAARFDRLYPGFVAQNLELRSRLLKRTGTQTRSDALATVEANLRWAEAFRRTGIDPETFGELAFERRLAQDEASRER